MLSASRLPRPSRRTIRSDHDLDVVLDVLLEGRNVFDLVVFAVDLHALEAAFQELGKLPPIFTLPTAGDGRQDVNPGFIGHLQNPVYHLADGLALDGQAGGG